MSLIQRASQTIKRLPTIPTSRFLTVTPRLSQVNHHLHNPPANLRNYAMALIPKTMKGVLIEETGGVEVLQYKTDLPVPTPAEGQVLIKNDFIGINYIDTYFRTGLYPSTKPEILGREGEGTVIAVSPTGNTYDFKVNDRVAWLGTGAYAEYSVCKAEKVFRLSEGIKPTIAAASLLQGLTALTLIKEAYEVKKGDWVLVHAAAGGVGLWLCQLLKAVGAKVIGTASNPFKIDLAKKHGAEYMIDYSHEDIVTGVKDITGGAGVAAVFDGVGASTFEADLEVLARKGTLASFGNASGPVPPLTISRLSAKNLKICRPTLFNYISLREEFTKYTEEMFNMVVKENIDVNIHEIYKLEDVARAHTDLEGRKTTGKLLLRP